MAPIIADKYHITPVMDLTGKPQICNNSISPIVNASIFDMDGISFQANKHIKIKPITIATRYSK